MKAILEFDLPEDQEAFELCQKASNMNATIDMVYNKVRNHLKHGSNKKDCEVLEEVQFLLSEHY